MKKLKIYLLTITALGILGCSPEDPDDGPETDSETNDLLASNFISTIESWNNLPLNSVEWVHETNSEGELVKSTMYEKYPRRILWELQYLDYNEDQLPTEYEKNYFSYGESVDTVIWDVTYNEDGTVEGLTAYRDGVFSHEYSFNQLDDKNRVKNYEYFDDTGELVERVVQEYDENGNHKSATVFNSESGIDDDSGFIKKWDWTYTHFGDRDFTQYLHNESGTTTEFTYSYREDFTHERTESITISQGNPDYIYLTEFNEEEKIASRSVTYGDQRWEYVSYFPNGNIEIAEFYLQDVLMWIETYAEDGSSEWKVINPDGTYRIEYIDEERTVYKVEFYDADDNLLSTENYKSSKKIPELQRRICKPSFPKSKPNSDPR